MDSEERFLANIKKLRDRNYQSQPVSIWHKLPVSRRAAVFILLFLGNSGELRVILTKRSSKLRSFPGHISLPGGKADTGLESEWQVARREMMEEIGLDEDNAVLRQKFGFTIDHLKIMPSYLSRTFSAVRPCVGFMKYINEQNLGSLGSITNELNLSLNPGESSSIFSCPLRDFLYPASDSPPRESLERSSHQLKWGGIPWDLRSYTFSQEKSNEVSWLKEIKDLSATDEESGDSVSESEEGSRETSEKLPKAPKQDLSQWGKLGSRRDETTNEKIYDVWGLTANILHDLAEVTYLSTPKRELGEEELIYSVWNYGNQMRTKERSEEEVKLIQAKVTDKYGFADILPRTEYIRLKSLYKM